MKNFNRLCQEGNGSPSNEKEESFSQGSMGNAGLYFVNQVSLQLCFSEILTVIYTAKFQMYLTTKSFLFQSLKRLLYLNYVLEKTAICYYYLIITGIAYFHWRKSLQCSLSSVKPHSPPPVRLPHWQGNLLHAAIEANAYLDYNIYSFIHVFLFICLSY